MDRVLEVGGYATGYCERLSAQCGYDIMRVESADNRSVLKAWLGYDDDHVAAPERAGVLVDKPPR